MVLLIDEPSSRAHLGCLGQMNGHSVILKELAVYHMIGFWDVYPLLLHLLEKVYHDNGNTGALRQANILSVVERTTSVCNLEAQMIEDIP
jgi:hypothetical protein